MIVFLLILIFLALLAGLWITVVNNGEGTVAILLALVIVGLLIGWHWDHTTQLESEIAWEDGLVDRNRAILNCWGQMMANQMSPTCSLMARDVRIQGWGQ